MLLLTVALFAASTAAQPARNMPTLDPEAAGALCPETPMSLARKMGKRPPQAVPLSKLPAGRTFMAVDRRVDGCPAPMTMTEYRGAGRR
jgi:hypothetical protein